MRIIIEVESPARFWCKKCGNHFDADALLVIEGAYCPQCGSGNTSPHVSRYMAVDYSAEVGNEHIISALLRVIKGE